MAVPSRLMGAWSTAGWWNIDPGLLIGFLDPDPVRSRREDNSGTMLDR